MCNDLFLGNIETLDFRNSQKDSYSEHNEAYRETVEENVPISEANVLECTVLERGMP